MDAFYWQQTVVAVATLANGRTATRVDRIRYASTIGRRRSDRAMRLRVTRRMPADWEIIEWTYSPRELRTGRV